MTDLFGSSPTYSDTQKRRLRILNRLKQSASSSKNGYVSGSVSGSDSDHCIPVTFGPSWAMCLYQIHEASLSVTQTNIGIDTMRLWITDFTVTDESKLADATAVQKTDLQTGELTEQIRLKTDRFTLTLNGTAAYVTASIPKLIRDTNEVAASHKETAEALQKLQRNLKQNYGVTTNLLTAKVSRLDVCNTIDLPVPLKQYGTALERLEFPRMQRTQYGNGNRRWSNKQRSITIYDKGRDQDGSASTLTRLEYSLKRLHTVRRQTGYETVYELLTHPNAVQDAYISAVERLFDIPDAGPDTEATGPEAFRAVLEAIAEEQSRSVPGTALQAFAVAEASGGFVDALPEIVAEVLGRQAAYRFRKKLKRLQGYADAYRDATDTVADRVAELRSAFL